MYLLITQVDKNPSSASKVDKDIQTKPDKKFAEMADTVALFYWKENRGISYSVRIRIKDCDLRS